MKNKFLLFIFCLVFSQVFSQNTAINELIINAGKYDDPKSSNETISSNDEISPESGIKCTVKTIKRSEVFENYITFNEMQDLYPGSIIQGKYLQEGKLLSIGNFSRQPITLIVDGLDVMSKNIQNPNKATITDAINGMLRNYKGSSKAKFEFNKVDAYSKKQALFDLGISAKWLTGSAGGNLELSSNKEEHTVFIYFKQSYYTISIDFPSNPSMFFSNDINIEDLNSIPVFMKSKTPL